MNYVYVDCRHVQNCDVETRPSGEADMHGLVDMGRLYLLVGGEPSEIGRAALYGARPPDHDSIWELAERLGFELTVASEGEAPIESVVVTDILGDSYELMDFGRDSITLVGGSLFYLPMLRRLRARGAKVRLACWSRASAAFEAAADPLTLDEHLRALRQRSGTGG